jgi:small-conductance mechanosensitive channel
VRLRPQKRIPVAEPTRTLVRRPRFRRALFTGGGALVALIAGSSLVPRHARTVTGRVLLDLPALVFLVLVVVCARSTAAELDALARWRGGQTAGSALQMVVTCFGYAIALIGTLSMVSVPVGHLLLGGAIVGVVLGIAAQQSLGNAFAGMVLLVARPFAVGNYIRVRSGALGGEFYGTVTAMSLTYVSVLTDQGMLKVPNSSVLAAAVGPYRRPPEQSPTVDGPDMKQRRSEPFASASAGPRPVEPPDGPAQRS